MTTGTAQVSPASRQDPRQVVNTLRKTFNFNDAAIATGVAFDNSIPLGAFILNVDVEIVTAFDGTPTFTVGTNSTSYNDLASSADVTATATGVYSATRGKGRSIAATADKTPYAKLAATSPTVGQAIVVITYEGGWST